MLSKIRRTLSSGRNFYSFLVRLGLSESHARWISKIVMTVRHRSEIASRKDRYKTSFAAAKALAVNEQKGCITGLSVSALPGGAEFLEACKQIAAAGRGGDSYRTAKGKAYREDVLLPEDFANFPALTRFLSSELIVASAAQYLGTMPYLGTSALWVTNANDQTTSAQLFHIDQEDFRQLKLFVNIGDTIAENGPVTFYPADISAKIIQKVDDPFHRVTDEEIAAAVKDHEAVRLVGEAGTAALVDTSRCLHQGSRTRLGRRILFMASYFAFPPIREPHDIKTGKVRVNYTELPEWAPMLFSKIAIPGGGILDGAAVKR